MQNLIFQELLLLSRKDKRARKITFSPKTNVITGRDNDVGKSTVLKSLYYCLGCSVPKIKNDNWSKSQPVIYSLRFTLGNKSYRILREGDSFGLFDENDELISRHNGITRTGEELDGIAHQLNPLLGFNVNLHKKDGSALFLGPEYYFLPFYIDQDTGWKASWSSFDSLSKLPRYKSNMLNYHLSIQPQKHFDALYKKAELQQELKIASEEFFMTEKIASNYKHRRASNLLDLDFDAYKVEIEELVKKISLIKSKADAVLEEIKQKRNEKLALESEIQLFQKAIDEYEKDYIFCTSKHSSSEVSCPICETSFSNSILERFSYLSDIDYCNNMLKQLTEMDIKVTDELADLNKKYQSCIDGKTPLERALVEKKGDITLAELIKAEGAKDILEQLAEELSAQETSISGLETKIKKQSDIMLVDSKAKAKIIEHYTLTMKKFSEDLQLSLNERVLSTPDAAVNETGSRLPKTVLAQHFSYLSVMKKFSDFVLCPLVIDTPKQQDLSAPNQKKVLEFILKNKIPNQQMIVATVGFDSDVKNYGINIKNDEIKKIELKNKLRLLSDDEYDEAYKTIRPLYRATLGIEEKDGSTD